MPYAVTLPLDAEAAARIWRMRHALAEDAGTDDTVRLGYPPHVTLAVLPDDAPISGAEAAVSHAVAEWTAFSIVLAGFGIFPGTPPVVWVAPVVTTGLLARHASLCSGLASFDIHPHYRPGNWVPHVTLSQAAPSAARAIEVITPDVGRTYHRSHRADRVGGISLCDGAAKSFPKAGGMRCKRLRALNPDDRKEPWSVGTD